MELIVHLDAEGLIKVDIIATPEQAQVAHAFWEELRPAIEALGQQAAKFSYCQREGAEILTERPILSPHSANMN